MSGHSKWSKIKHQKGVDDIKRGNMFTKLTREIMIAVREGGSNQEANFRLRLAVAKARDSNMPYDNIDRAIKKGAGELGGASLAEFTLEGYGPSGIAVMVQGVSDNKNRTVQDVRSIFSRHGGSLAESGGVAWIFDPRGVITIKTDGLNPDDITLIAIDAGAEDVKEETGYMEIYTKPEELEKVRAALEQKNIKVDSSEISMVPKTQVRLDDKSGVQALKLLDKMEELDEVQNVYSNADFSDEVLEAYRSEQLVRK